ncbi:MAG TPA: ATP-binding cassette domain-containing protein [Vicinamibacterales bacterium]|nr:ATP-binding cassette domain-containing protein [Vicinamibacterales bacterium]
MMVDAQALAVRYGGRDALAGVSVRIAEGERVLLTGRSGCGKSTFVRCLNGLVPHVVPARLAGRLSVAGRTPADTPVEQMAGLVGMVFQSPATQFFNLTVGEEVAAGPRNLGLDEPDVAARVDEALAWMGLAGLDERTIPTLSGGERQRLAIASALAMRPRLLVLDEPTSHLDVHGTRQLLQALTGAALGRPLTILLVEHRLGEVAHFTARTLVMDEGRIVADGATDEVFGRREWLRALGLRRPAATAGRDWIDLIVADGVERRRPILSVRNLRVARGRRAVIEDLSMTLHEGEFAALVGDNGAGKSTLAHVLAGLRRPQGGEVRWHAGRGRPGRDVALLFQDPGGQLFCDAVGEEVRFGPENYGERDSSAAAAALEATGLQAMASRGVQQLSLGEQQRTVLAALLALRPRVLILDEPTVGQDWGHLQRFMDFLASLTRAGTTVLLISHDFKLVHRYAERVMLLRGGRIAAEGKPAERVGEGASGVGGQGPGDAIHAS